MKTSNDNTGNKFLLYTGIALIVLGIAAQIAYAFSAGSGVGKAFYLCGLAFILLGSSAALKGASQMWNWQKIKSMVGIGITVFLAFTFLSFALCIFGNSNIFWVDIACPLGMGIGAGIMFIGFEHWGNKQTKV